MGGGSIGLRAAFAVALGVAVAAWAGAAVGEDLAADCVQMEDPELSIGACTEVIRIGETAGASLAWAYANRGIAYAILGRHEEAIDDFDRLVNDYPGVSNGDENGYTLRGGAYMFLGQHDRAIDDFDQAIRLDPDNGVAYGMRGAVYAVLGQHERAIDDFDQAIPLIPDNAQVYRSRGGTHLLLGHHEQAIHDYDEAIRLDPDDARAYSLRGDAYVLSGQHERAIEDFDQAIRLDPDHAQVYVGRGHAYRVLRRYEDAIRDFDQAIRLDPEQEQLRISRATAQDWLARSLYLDGRPAEGLAHAEEALTVLPDDFLVIDTRAHIYAALGRVDEAVADFERAMEIGGENRVRKYQDALATHGFAPGSVDGIYDDQMRTALRACIETGCRLLE